jgi:hypothetical protein
MPALLIVAGAGVAISAVSSLLAGRRAGKAAESQAKTQKGAMNRFAKALQSKADKIQGGMSEAQRRSLATGGALQAASAAQQARDEADRAGRVIDEGELADAQQMGLAAQQQGIDALSSQQAVAKAAQRDSLEMQALQASTQAQSIDPAAARQAQMAPALGQAGATIGGAVANTALGAAQPMLQTYGTTQAYDRFQASKAGTDGVSWEAIRGVYDRPQYDANGRLLPRNQPMAPTAVTPAASATPAVPAASSPYYGKL